MPERAGSSTRRGSAEAKESKRQEIAAAAAADCFERYRVQRVRVEDIAQAAGISGTNFYHFFPAARRSSTRWSWRASGGSWTRRRRSSRARTFGTR